MKRSTFAVLTISALGLAACGDDGTGPNTGNLTQAEAEALAGILMSQSYQATESGVQPAAGGPQAVPIDFESTVDVNVPCLLGGNVTGTATVHFTGDTELEGGTIEYSMTQTHHDCVAQDEESGLTFTLNGDPNMTTEMTLETDGQGSLSLSGSIGGGIAWSNDEKSGSCSMSLTFTGSGNAATGAGSSSVSGTICGVDVSQQVSVS